MATVPTDQDPTLSSGQVKKPATAPAPASPALPIAGAPAAQAPAPAGPGAGQGAALPIAPAVTADPMAFQPPPGGVQLAGGATGTPASVIDAQNGGFGTPGLSSVPTSTWQDPFEGKSEQFKTDYWAGQGAQGLAGVGYTPPAITQAGVSGGQQPGYDPAAEDAATAKYKTDNADRIKSVTDQVHGASSAYQTDAENFWRLNPNATQLPDGILATLGGPDSPAAQQAYASKGSVVGGAPSIGAPAGAPRAYEPPQFQPTPEQIAGARAGAVQPPTGPASDTNPSTQPSLDQIQQILQQAPSNSGPATSTDPRVGNGVGLTATTPDNALTNQTISVDPSVDRFKVANQQLQDTIKNTLDPQFKADSDTIAANSFGLGRGVSGMNRTSQGNLAAQEGRTIAQTASNFLNPALTGTIGDAYNNAGIAQQQQGFQAGQQRDAFGQAVTGQQLADSENNQSFNQALQQLLAGSSGDPAQLEYLLAQIYGGQGAQSGAAAQNLAGTI